MVFMTSWINGLSSIIATAATVVIVRVPLSSTTMIGTNTAQRLSSTATSSSALHFVDGDGFELLKI